MTDDGMFRRSLPGDKEAFETESENTDFSEEFIDHGSFDENDDVLEGEDNNGEWESYDSETVGAQSEETEAEVAAKKAKFNKMVIGGALGIGALVLLLSTLGHHGATRINTSNLQNAGQLPGTGPAKIIPPKPIVAASATSKPSGGLLNDDTALNGITGKMDDAAAQAQAQAQAAKAATANQAQASQTGSAAPTAPLQPMAMQSAPGGQSGESLTPMPVAANANAPAVDNALTSPAKTGPGMAGVPSAPAPSPAMAQMPTAPPDVLPNSQFMKADATAQSQPPQPFTAPAPVMQAPAPAPVMAPAPMAAPVTAAGSPQPSTPPADARIDDLLNRISVIESKLAEIQKQPSDSDLQTLQQSVDQINTRLTHLEQRPVVPASVPAAAPADVAATVVSPAAAAQPVAAQPVPVSHSHEQKNTGHGEKTSARWVLKSAQPGQAYVSRRGQDDMINVHPGDTLPGIGRVVTIKQADGRWEIQGSLGHISQ